MKAFKRNGYLDRNKKILKKKNLNDTPVFHNQPSNRHFLIKRTPKALEKSHNYRSNYVYFSVEIT